MASSKKLRRNERGVSPDREISSNSAELAKRMLDVDLADARQITNHGEKVKTLCQVAVTAKSLDIDPVPILEEAVNTAKLIPNVLERGIFLMGIAGFYNRTENDPLPTLDEAVSDIVISPTSRIRDETLIKIARIYTDLRKFDLATSTVNNVSDVGARNLIRGKINDEKEYYRHAN